MEIINVPVIKLEAEEGNRAVFVIEPFYPGYGITVGNAIRRVLLTSLPGAAATAFKISGIDHEFTTIDGIKEDVVEIMLNIKGLRFLLHEDGPVTVTLKATKEGAVTGKDIKLPSSVEITNPDHHIATLTSKTSLDMDIRIENGRGYVLSEEIDNREFSIGTIAIDAVFSPVNRASIQVENTRVGEKVDYDKLTLEVETDGTITPRDALRQAADILLEQFNVFTNQPLKKEVAKVAVPSSEEKDDAEDKEDSRPQDFTIEEINLSIRTTNALMQNGIKKVKQIISLGRTGLLEMKGVGARAVTEIADKLDELGLEFK
ncbi:DNA-directed RNA polymerase subunit alpha [Patescibacteria group bacterium]|nr:DNA-directed RNA polymerase subunit alpha [Patescibacteria group bacterium]